MQDTVRHGKAGVEQRHSQTGVEQMPANFLSALVFSSCPSPSHGTTCLGVWGTAGGESFYSEAARCTVTPRCLMVRGYPSRFRGTALSGRLGAWCSPITNGWKAPTDGPERGALSILYSQLGVLNVRCFWLRVAPLGLHQRYASGAGLPSIPITYCCQRQHPALWGMESICTWPEGRGVAT